MNGLVFGHLPGDRDNLVVESQNTPRITLHHRPEFGEAHALRLFEEKVAADETLQAA